MKCNLSIKLSIPKGATVEVQIKKNDSSILNIKGKGRLTSDNPELTIDLSEYKRSTWENIKELCFTAFYQDFKGTKESVRITVDECAFILPEAK